MKAKVNDRLLIVFVIAVVFIIIAALIAPAFDSRTTNGLKYDFNDNWLEVLDDGTKISFNDFGKEIQSKRIVLSHDLSDIPEGVNSIGFYNYYSAVEMYIDDVLVYSYGSQDDLDNGRLLGNYYSMVDLHHDTGDSDVLTIVFISNYAQTVYGFDIGHGPTLEMVMIRQYISALVLPIITLLFIAVAIILRRKKTTKDLAAKNQLMLIIFSLNLSVWIIADSQLPMDIGMNAGTVCLISFESYMLLPAALSMLMYYSCSVMRNANITISILAYVNFAALNILNIGFRISFLETLLSTHVIVGIGLAVTLVQVLLNYSRNQSRPALLLLIGYVSFLVCALVQYARFFINPTESNSTILQFGSIVFVVLLISNLLKTVNDRIYRVSEDLEIRNRLLQKAFGSFLPDEMIKSIMEDPDDFSMQGETKNLTVIQSDIRGFTELIREMPAQDVIDMINHYLENMTTVLQRFGGTIMEFVGDGIVAVFDANKLGAAHADKAVFAAVEMQNLMTDINKWNKSKGYPAFEMGIGINTGTAYVGYVGSKARMKYDALGSTVNLASRIESYSTGGQILISETTKLSCSVPLELDNTLKVLPKGVHEPIDVYLLGAIGSPYNLECRFRGAYPKTLIKPVEIQFYMVEEKHVGEMLYTGHIVAVSKDFAVLQTERQLRLYDNLRIENPYMVSCKVVSKSENGLLVRFTSGRLKDDIVENASLFGEEK